MPRRTGSPPLNRRPSGRRRYATLSRSSSHAASSTRGGQYRCITSRIRGQIADMDKHAAQRRLTRPRRAAAEFAVEAHMDRIAARDRDRSGSDREVNALPPGDTTAPAGHTARRGPIAARRTRAAAVAAHRASKRRRRALAAWPRRWRVRRGIGVACFSRIRLHRRRRSQARLESVDRARRARSVRAHSGR